MRGIFSGRLTDDLIEINTRLNMILEEMAQMIYREWFVNFRFPGHERVRFWISFLIAIAVVVRRLVELISPSSARPAQMQGIDATFSSHAVLTAMHFVPATLFVIIAAWILLGRSNTDRLEPFFFVFGIVTGLTAYWMSAYAEGGWIERSAVVVFDTYYLFSLGRAYLLRLRGEPVRKREWMSRAVAILLGIVATRPVIGVFFATSARTHLTPHQFFGIAFWIGFSINAMVIELRLHSDARKRRPFRRTPVETAV